MNPILIDVLRGGFVESAHRGAVHVVDDSGQEIFSVGDVKRLVFPRSAIKIMQALPMVEAGAVERFGLSDKQLSLICASHGGEVLHTEMAASILTDIGAAIGDLQCGAHMPVYRPAEHEMVKAGQEATALHNNCSGKHAGMLAYAQHVGFEMAGYINLEHPIQVEIAKVMSELTEFDLSSAPCGIDGCSLPTWAAPLTAWAHAFAKMSRGRGLGAVRAEAVIKLQAAVMAEPFYVAGSKRYCTRIMSELSLPIFVKLGAEGVFCASLPEHGIGIVVKCDDGSARGAEMMLSATLKAIGVLKGDDLAVIERFLLKNMKNWNGFEVGNIKPSNFWEFS